MPPDERLSMAEQLSATYDKLEAETPDVVVADEPVADAPIETEEAKAERLRDEAGRFKAEPREKLTLKPKEAKDAAPEQKREAPRESAGKEAPAGDQPRDAGKPADGGRADAPILPPSNWSGKGKVQWE